jgi:hypothetical protein
MLNTKLLPILPGANKKVISVGSRLPSEIMRILDNFKSDCDTVVLTNGDVWRYFSAEEEIFNHPNLANKNVFLTSMGYTNEYRGNNHWHISFPFFYFNRQIIPFAEKSQNLERGFGCLNHRPALHRLILGTKLFKNDLLKHMIFTQSQYNRRDQKSGDLAVNGLESEILSAISGFDEYKKCLPIIWDHDDYDKWLVRGNEFRESCEHPAYTDTYCNIVTEAECEEIPYSDNVNLPVVTEKSYKPFIAGQIPIMLAAQGHVAYFKSLGFEMMEDLLPKDYDKINTLEKIDAIINVVANGTEYIKDFYFSHLNEIKHNYDLVSSDKVDNLILQNIKDIINGRS